MFLGHYTSGPLEGSKYIQDQSTSHHVFIQKDTDLDFLNLVNLYILG